MRTLEQKVWYALIAMITLAITVGTAPTSSAQAPSASPALESLPGVTAEAHGDHVDYVLEAATPQDDPNVIVDPDLLSGLRYRSTGFNRGGRATAVTGIPDQPYTFFVGYSGGGVWKTEDAGTTWGNISDGYFNVGSIGDIKVAPSDPNVIWVGTGSGCPRGNISTGDGIYKSTDCRQDLVACVEPGVRASPRDGGSPGEPGSLIRSRVGQHVRFGPGARYLRDH